MTHADEYPTRVTAAAPGDPLAALTAPNHAVGNAVDVDWDQRIDDEFERVPATAALDAAGVLGALDEALELVEVWLADGAPGTVDDRYRIVTTIRDVWQKRNGRLSGLRGLVEDSLLGDVPLYEVSRVDGLLYRPARHKQRSGFQKEALRSRINRHACAPIPVLDDGEVKVHRNPTVGEILDTVWAAADVATGRTKVLRERFGIDLDDYGDFTYRTTIDLVDENELTPEEREALTDE